MIYFYPIKESGSVRGIRKNNNYRNVTFPLKQSHHKPPFLHGNLIIKEISNEE